LSIKSHMREFWYWTCPECGEEVTTRPKMVGYDPERRRDIMECIICGYQGPLEDWKVRNEIINMKKARQKKTMCPNCKQTTQRPRPGGYLNLWSCPKCEYHDTWKAFESGFPSEKGQTRDGENLLKRLKEE